MSYKSVLELIQVVSSKMENSNLYYFFQNFNQLILLNNEN